MEKKEIHCKFTYQCGICGSSYDNVLDRAKCEIKCNEKAEAEAKKAAEAKKMAEQKARKEAVDESVKRTAKIIEAYIKDYGHYEYNDIEPIKNLFCLDKLWSLF